jgi:hypothetical protein
MLTVPDATSQLDGARRAHTDAQAAIASATAAFDATGSDHELEQLQSARSALAGAAERVARAERILASAKQAAAEAERAAKAREVEDIRAELAVERVVAQYAPYHARLTEHLLGLADTLNALRKARSALNARAEHANRLLEALDAMHVGSRVSAPWPHSGIEERLNQRASELHAAAANRYAAHDARTVREVLSAFKEFLRHV